MIEFVGDLGTISWKRQYRTSSRVQAVSDCLPDWGLIVSRFADFIPNQLSFWCSSQILPCDAKPWRLPIHKVWLASSWASSRCCIIFLISGVITFHFFLYNIECSQGGVLIWYTEKQVIETWHLIVVFKEADSVPRYFWDSVKEFISIKVLIQTGRDRNRLISGELQIQSAMNSVLITDTTKIFFTIYVYLENHMLWHI